MTLAPLLDATPGRTAALWGRIMNNAAFGD
jgi:hypothetical protein